MPSHSEKQRRFFGLVRAVQKGDKSPNDVSSHIRDVAKKVSAKDASAFASSVAESETKKKVLSILKELKKPTSLNETETNPVAKQFTIKDDFEKYVKRYLGQPFTPKEIDALNNFEKAKPTKIERTEIRFETTDEFNNNTSVVVKKMKDSGQFSYNAFTKHKKAEPKEEEPKTPEPPQEPSTGPGAPAPEPPPAPETPQEDKDDIVILKSVLFKDDIKGAAILVEFLKELDL